MIKVEDHFKVELNTEGNCEWLKIDTTFSKGQSLDTLAESIAYEICYVRLGENTDYFRLWNEAYTGIRSNDAKTKAILTSFFVQSIGLKGDATPEGQVQSVVAETLCYIFTKNRITQNGVPIRIERPHFTVTDSGGDGLAVYVRPNGEYIFRLWESKKQETIKSATSKITIAAEQLHNKGNIYLAQLSKIEQEVDYSYPGLSEFYNNLVVRWIENAPESNAGISINKNEAAPITNLPISFAKKKLVKFVNDQQIEVFVINVPDLALLARKVKDVVWKGI